MSLTSYRAAPPRGIGGSLGVVFRNAFRVGFWLPFGRPGGDLLSHVLGRSTIGAEGFHGRVRDGIGCMAPRHDHQVVGTEAGERVRLVFGRGLVVRCRRALVPACDGRIESSRTSD